MGCTASKACHWSYLLLRPRLRQCHAAAAAPVELHASSTAGAAAHATCRHVQCTTICSQFKEMAGVSVLSAASGRMQCIAVAIQGRMYCTACTAAACLPGQWSGSLPGCRPGPAAQAPPAGLGCARWSRTPAAIEHAGQSCCRSLPRHGQPDSWPLPLEASVGADAVVCGSLAD